MFLHVLDAVNHGYCKVKIRKVDSVQQLRIDELWVAFASGKSFSYLPAHEMTRALAPEKCIALPVLHAFSGCDTVSSFAGKKTVWEIWVIR